MKFYRLKKDSIGLKAGKVFRLEEGVDVREVEPDTLEHHYANYIGPEQLEDTNWFEEVEIKVEPKNKPKRQYKKRRKTHPGGGSEAVQLRRNRAYAMHLNGKSPKYIARELNISHSTVSRYLKEAVEV